MRDYSPAPGPVVSVPRPAVPPQARNANHLASAAAVIKAATRPAPAPVDHRATALNGLAARLGVPVADILAAMDASGLTIETSPG